MNNTVALALHIPDTGGVNLNQRGIREKYICMNPRVNEVALLGEGVVVQVKVLVPRGHEIVLVVHVEGEEGEEERDCRAAVESDTQVATNH
jgi:hypothetical protein